MFIFFRIYTYRFSECIFKILMLNIEGISIFISERIFIVLIKIKILIFKMFILNPYIYI